MRLEDIKIPSLEQPCIEHQKESVEDQRTYGDVR